LSNNSLIFYYFKRSNLLNGGVTLGFPKNGNENVQQMTNKNVKSTCFGIGNAFSSNNIFSKTTQQTTVFNSRNALGDIGNKITCSSSQQLLLKKDGLKTEKAIVVEEKVTEEAIELNDSSVMEVSNCEIIDIDEFDTENTQLVAEYVKDIYGYLTSIEVCLILIMSQFCNLNFIIILSLFFRNNFVFRQTFWKIKLSIQRCDPY